MMQQTFYAFLLILLIITVDASGVFSSDHIDIIPMRSKPSHHKSSPTIAIPRRTKSSRKGEEAFICQKRFQTSGEHPATSKVYKRQSDPAPPPLAITKTHIPSNHKITTTDSSSQPRDWGTMISNLNTLHKSRSITRSRSFDSLQQRTSIKPKLSSARYLSKPPSKIIAIFIPFHEEPLHKQSTRVEPSELFHSISAPTLLLSPPPRAPPNTPMPLPEHPSFVPIQSIEPLEPDSPGELQEEDEYVFPPQSPETILYYESLAKENYRKCLDQITYLSQRKSNLKHNIKTLETFLLKLEAASAFGTTDCAAVCQEMRTTMCELELELERIPEELHTEIAQLEIYGRAVGVKSQWKS